MIMSKMLFHGEREKPRGRTRLCQCMLVSEEYGPSHEPPL